MRWLDQGEANPTLAVTAHLGGSASYTALDWFFNEDQLLMPGFRGRREITLDRVAQDHPLHNRQIGPLRNAIAAAEESIALLDFSPS